MSSGWIVGVNILRMTKIINLVRPKLGSDIDRKTHKEFCCNFP